MVLLDSCSSNRCFTFSFPGPLAQLFAFLQYNTAFLACHRPAGHLIPWPGNTTGLNGQQETNQASFMFCAVLVSLLLQQWQQTQQQQQRLHPFCR